MAFKPLRPSPGDGLRRSLAAPNIRRPELLDRTPGVGQQALIRDMQSAAGNAAVSRALQRAGGWPDASGKGPAWNNAKAKAVGRVWRLAIAGLAGGAVKPFKDGNSEHTTEKADHRAIVLVPIGFDPKKPVDVLLHFHGHTETWRGKYAGMRQRSFKPTDKTKEAGLTSDDKVRDVDLDQIEQQIESSGKRQTIGILAQGGPQGEFGDFNTDAYIKDVLERTNKEYKAELTAVPTSWSVILSGHSGGGSRMRDALSAKNRPANLKGLILFDAESMHIDMPSRIKADLEFLADPAHSDPDRAAYLAGRPRVRAFTSAGSVYAGRYQDIVNTTIVSATNRLFPANRKAELAGLRKRQSSQPLTAVEELRLKDLRKKRRPDKAGRDELKALSERQANKSLSAREVSREQALTQQESRLLSVEKFLPQVQIIYQLTELSAGIGHEEIIRGTPEKSGAYKKGQGNLEKALVSMP